MTNGCWVFDELFSKLNFILSESPLTVVMFQPPGSSSGVLTSDSSLVTEEARVQAEHMVPTSLRSVITLILVFTGSFVALCLLPGFCVLL